MSETKAFIPSCFPFYYSYLLYTSRTQFLILVKFIHISAKNTEVDSFTQYSNLSNCEVENINFSNQLAKCC